VPQTSPGRLCEKLGEPEVHDLDEIEARTERLEDDVVRFHVSVHDAEGVRLAECGERLLKDVDDSS